MKAVRLMQRLANSDGAGSLGNRLRRRRFERFVALFESIPRPVRILDLGGTENFWRQMGIDRLGDVSITLVNLDAEPGREGRFERVVGDARTLPQFDDRAFDLVFSNSVIEHVGTLEDQRRMANEVCRLAPRYYVQTPNYHFPVEPHFLFPGWQFLPESTRVWLLRRFPIGWYGRIRDPERALAAVREIRLLTRAELRALFPDAALAEEKVLGLTKSFTAYAGF